MNKYEHCGKCGKPIILGGFAPSGWKHLRGIHDHVVTSVKINAKELARLKQDLSMMLGRVALAKADGR